MIYITLRVSVNTKKIPTLVRIFNVFLLKPSHFKEFRQFNILGFTNSNNGN